MPIKYIVGDATSPSALGPKIIVHICNDVGKWGKGFVLAISRRWRAPEQSYRASFARGPALRLGDVQFVPVAPDLVVANLIGQHDVARRDNPSRPVRYDAIEAGLRHVRARAADDGASVHMPRIGSGNARGDWAQVESIIQSVLVDPGVSVTVYDLPAR